MKARNAHTPVVARIGERAHRVYEVTAEKIKIMESANGSGR